MSNAQERLVSDLEGLGVKKGDCLLVHSSYAAVGKQEGGPAVIIDALLQSIGKEGTLLMPSFASGQQYSLALENRVFELNTTPSQMGAISEVFRKDYPTQRSLHPTHSLTGMGLKAKEILQGHEKCLCSVGFGTPYDKFRLASGKILLLGVGNVSNTFLHFVENTLGAPTLSRNQFIMKAIDDSNQLVLVKMHPHLPGLPRCYERLNEELPETIQTKAIIGNAPSYLIDAAALYEYMKPRLQANPMYLIKPFQPES